MKISRVKIVFYIFTLILIISSLFFKENINQVKENNQNQNTEIINQESKDQETGIVTKVVDGDTIEVLIDGKTEKVRYIGVDTPETVDPRKPVQCMGKEASEKNKELVLNKKIYLEKDITDRDKYDRLLRYVYTDEYFVNKELVKQGFAKVYTYPPDVKYIPDFLAEEKIARENQKGLWGMCEEKTLIEKDKTNKGSCVIKGNISLNGEKIYHTPNCEYYSKTQINESNNEKWFCSEEEALSAGWRKALNCQ